MTKERLPIFICADHYGTGRSNFKQPWNNTCPEKKVFILICFQTRSLVPFSGRNVLIPEYSMVELGFCVSAFLNTPTLLTEALPLSEYSTLTSAILGGLPDSGASCLCPFCLPTEVEQPDVQAWFALAQKRWLGQTLRPPASSSANLLLAWGKQRLLTSQMGGEEVQEVLHPEMGEDGHKILSVGMHVCCFMYTIYSITDSVHREGNIIYFVHVSI